MVSSGDQFVLALTPEWEVLYLNVRVFLIPSRKKNLELVKKKKKRERKDDINIPAIINAMVEPEPDLNFDPIVV